MMMPMMSNTAGEQPPFQVKEPSRMNCLVMPSPRTCVAGGGGGFPKTPGPLEMGMRSIGLQSGSIPFSSKAFLSQSSFPYKFPATTGGGGGAVGCVETGIPAVGSYPPVSSSPSSSSGGGVAVVVVPGWATPAGYALCGLCMGLCNLIAPGYIQSCAHFLCPLWSLSLGLHIACGSVCEREESVAVGKEPLHSCWMWGGVLTMLLLPFVVMIGSSLFVCFYLFVFSVFSSGMFWRRLQGPSFILAWLSWLGFLVSCGLGLGSVLPAPMNLCVAAFFAISLGVLNSGGVKFVMRIG